MWRVPVAARRGACLIVGCGERPEEGRSTEQDGWRKSRVDFASCFRKGMRMLRDVIHYVEDVRRAVEQVLDDLSTAVYDAGLEFAVEERLTSLVDDARDEVEGLGEVTN